MKDIFSNIRSEPSAIFKTVGPDNILCSHLLGTNGGRRK